MASRKLHMPNMGVRELNEFTSWRLASRSMAGTYETFRRLGQQRDAIGNIYAANRAQQQAKNYAAFTSGFANMRGQIGGRYGKAFDSSIATFLKRLESGGGSKIGSADLTKAIGEFQKSVGRIASQMHGVQGGYLRGLSHDLKDARRNAREGGLGALGGNSKDFIKTAYGLKTDNVIQDACNQLANDVRKVGKTLTAPHLKQAVKDATDQFQRAAASAKTVGEKQDAMTAYADKIKSIGNYATNSQDKLAMGALGGSADKQVKELKTAITAQNKNRVWSTLNSGIGNLNRALGGTLRYLQPLKRSLDIGNDVFQAVNSRFNQFARMQMGVSAERGAYGRQLRGAGIGYGHMMGALAAGRSAGMDDRTVVNQMVDLQTQLAQARWGEGGLIDAAGRWGISTYDESGNVKDANQMMIEFSRKLNSLGSKSEKLQFLTHIGRRPEEMEYIANYEKQAKRQDFLKAHPEMRGVLDKADYLDESGFSAKADAATKIELRRREVLNQNAIEQGIIPGLMRSLSPENWFFSDWTARKQGVESARSEQAMENLTKELQSLATEIKKTEGKVGVGSLSGRETNLSSKELKALSLTGGWAEASQKNYGEKSSVHILKNIIGKNDKGVSSRTQKNINRGTGTVAGALGGALLGAGAGALAGAVIGGIGALFTGGASLAAIPALMAAGAKIGGTKGGLVGALGGGFGGALAGGKLMEDSTMLDFSSADVEEARKAAKGSDEDWEKWQNKTGLTNLKRSQVLDVDFDKQAMEGAKVQSLVARATELAGGKEVNLEAVAGDKYLGQMTAGLSSSSKEYEDRFVEALARTADETIGRSEAILQILKKGVNVSDPIVAKRVDELAKANMGNGMGRSEATEKAREQVKNEVQAEAIKNGDLINQQVAENQKQAEADYAAYEQSKKEDDEFVSTAKEVRAQYEHAQATNPFARNMSYQEWLNKQSEAGNKDVKKLYDLEGKDRFNRSFNRETGEATIKDSSKLSKEEWMEKNLGNQATQERRAYQQVYGENGPMAGKEAPWESLTGTLKNDKIKKFLQKKNFGGSNIKNYSGELAGLDDNGIVAKIALEQGASEDDVRNNILSKERYQELKAKKDKGDKLDGRDETLMRIYESSSNYKKEKAAADKKKDEEKEKEVEGINDIATYAEAARITGDTSIHADGSGYANMAAKSRQQYGLDAKSQKRLMELSTKRDFAGMTGKNLTEEEQAELSDLEKREAKQNNAKVDRKKLIRLVAAKGGDLSANFSQEEVDAYNKEQAEEKDRFVTGKRHTKGQYSLYKDIENRMLSGGKVDNKEKAFYDKEKKRLDRAKKSGRKGAAKSLHGDEYVPTAEEKAAMDSVDATSAKLKKERQADKNKPVLAQISDLRQMARYAKAGMSRKELGQRFNKDRLAQFDAAVKTGQIEVPKQAKKQTREDYEKFQYERLAAAGVTGERATKLVAGRMEAYDAMQKRKGGGKKGGGQQEPGYPTGEIEATAVMKGKTEGVEQVSAKMAEGGTAAEAAAASAKKANESSTASSQNVTINFGGQQITQNIQGNGKSMDEAGMKKGTLEGASEIRDKTAEAIAFVTQSKGSY